MFLKKHISFDRIVYFSSGFVVILTLIIQAVNVSDALSKIERKVDKVQVITLTTQSKTDTRDRLSTIDRRLDLIQAQLNDLAKGKR